MFSERSDLRLLTDLFDSETDCNYEGTSSPHMSLAMSMTAGLTSCSPIVCGFIFFAMRSKTTHDASVACLECKSVGFVAVQNRLGFSAAFWCSKNISSFSHVMGASSLDISSICFFQRFIRQHFIAQHILWLHSLTVTDRSKSQIQKFLVVGILSHPSMLTEFPIFNNNACNEMF